MKKIFILLKKIFILCWWLVVGCWCFAKPVLAKDFSSFYKVTYEFDKNGEVSVVQEISLQNLVSDLYVSQYSLSIVGGQLSKIEAFDKIGPLKIKTDLKGESTIVTLSFNENVVGKDKLLSFIFKYHISGLAKKEGSLWQVSIPKLVNSEDINDFDLLLKIPTEYGKLSIINPNPLEQKILDNYFQAKFKKEQITNYGVIATFGLSQIFNFNITYDLKNDGSSPSIQKIAIPPDTNYQRVYYESIDPEPWDVTVDEDGNWLASFLVQPEQSLKINVVGQVNIFSQPKSLNFQKGDESSFAEKNCLSASKYWQVNDNKIRQLADKLKTPENIYKFVVSNLTYDYQNIENNFARKGALSALTNPKESTCTQFADLFVAIARAAGIPSREVEGYAYTNNPQLKEINAGNDLLHAWPEYFDKQRQEWIMIDPTWGNTTGGLDYFNKFDMSHFTFVIHGKTDTLPFPPGTHKEGESLGKQILVSLSDQELPIQKAQFILESLSPPYVFSGKNQQMEVIFKNKSKMAIYDQNLSIVSTPDSAILNKFIVPKTWSFGSILPYSTFKINFSLRPEERLKDHSQTLTFTMDGAEANLKIKIKSFILRLSVLLGAFLSIIILLLLFSVRTLKRKHSCDNKLR